MPLSSRSTRRRATSRSSTTRPWTTAARGSTRRSSRARCTGRPRTRSAPRCTRTSSTTRTERCSPPTSTTTTCRTRSTCRRSRPGAIGVAVAGRAARREGHGRGRRRRDPLHLLRDPGRAARGGRRRSSTTAATQRIGCGRCSRTRKRRARTCRWRRSDRLGHQGARRRPRETVWSVINEPVRDGEAHARRRVASRSPTRGTGRRR